MPNRRLTSTVPTPLKPRRPTALRKKSTGIAGFDELSGGGLPEGRLSAIVGGPGTGKSIFAAQYLRHRFVTDGEPGIFVSFEESPHGIAANLASFDWGLSELPEGAIAIVEARLPRDAEVAGDFDISALLAGLSSRIAATGARHVVFDGIDVLINALDDHRLERREVMRLEEWVRNGQLTAILTVKADWAGNSGTRRAELVQYVTDAVVLLENTLHAADLSRTLRVVKYRGSGFAANAVPVVIGSSGIRVIPAGAAREGYPVFSERMSTGIGRLDAVLGGGPLRGSSILVTGSPGTAKTSLAASMVDACCAIGGRAVFVSFDESDAQIIANMKSIGLDLGRHVRSGRLRMLSLMSAGHSPEECFLRISEIVRVHRPTLLVVDPMSSFTRSGYTFAEAISESLIHLAKTDGITFLGTSLIVHADGWSEESASHVSTIADVWIHLAYVAQNGERNRAITIIKARGTDHSNQVRELSLGATGLELIDVFAGEGQVLFGSARAEKLQQEKRRDMVADTDLRRRKLAAASGIAELELRMQAVMHELEIKRREIELDEGADLAVIEDRDDSLRERRRLRRGSDDGAARNDRRNRASKP